MPKYNLVVKYTDGVKCNILWNKLFMETEYDINNLMHIDFFTSRFKDKRELMEFIEFFELVEKRDIKKRIKIEYKNSGLVKEGQIIYKNDLKFLDIDYLNSYIILKYNDVKFLEYLVDCFKENPIQKRNISVFMTYINKYNYEFYSKYGFDPTFDEENNKKALLDFICRQIYKYDRDNKNYVYDGDTPVLNYKQFRDFAKIISNYSKKNDNLSETEEFENKYFKDKEIDNSIKKLIKNRSN